MVAAAEMAQWLLFKTPTINGDHGAFLIVALFLVVGFGALALWLLTWMVTGSVEMPIDESYGKPKE